MSNEKPLDRHGDCTVVWEFDGPDVQKSYGRRSSPSGPICASCVVQDIGESGLTSLQSNQQRLFEPVDKLRWAHVEAIEYDPDWPGLPDQSALNEHADFTFSEGYGEFTEVCADCGDTGFIFPFVIARIVDKEQ